MLCWTHSEMGDPWSQGGHFNFSWDTMEVAATFFSLYPWSWGGPYQSSCDTFRRGGTHTCFHSSVDFLLWCLRDHTLFTRGQFKFLLGRTCSTYPESASGILIDLPLRICSGPCDMYQLSPPCREHSAASSALLAFCSRQRRTLTRILWRQAEYCCILPSEKCIAHQHGSYGANPKYCCVLPSGESTAHYYLRFKVKVSGFPGCLLAKVNECTTESVALLLAQFFANTCAWWSVMVWLLLLLEHVRTRLESAMTSIFDIHFCLVGMKPPWLYDSPNSIINGWYAHVKPPRLYDPPNRSINSWYTRLKPNLTVQFTQQFH